MAEQEDENQPAGNVEEAEKIDDEFIPEDSWPLCLSCLKPCHPLQYYCDSCDSHDAISPLTPYIGFVNIWFNYGIFLTMWRKTWHEKETPLVNRFCYLFFLLLFAPILLIFGLPMLLIEKIEQPRLRRITTAAIIVIITLLIVLLILYNIPGRLVPGPIR